MMAHSLPVQREPMRVTIWLAVCQACWLAVAGSRLLPERKKRRVKVMNVKVTRMDHGRARAAGRSLTGFRRTLKTLSILNSLSALNSLSILNSLSALNAPIILNALINLSQALTAMKPVKQSRMRQSGAGQKMVSDQQPKATMVVAMAR